MAWAYTGRSATQTGSGGGSLNVTLASTVAGNQIFVGGSYFGFTTVPTACAVSDSTNGAYTQSFFNNNSFQGASLHYFANNAGGSLTITVNPTATDDRFDFWIVAAEFSGGDTSSLASGTPSSSNGLSTTASTGSTTAADSDALLVAMLGTQTAGTITENAASEGFTLLAENESGASAEPGSLVYKIVSGAPSAASHSWTVASGSWAAGIAGYKPGSAAATVDGPLIGFLNFSRIRRF